MVPKASDRAVSAGPDRTVGAVSLSAFPSDDDAVLSAAEVEAIRRGESAMSDLDAAEALGDGVSGLMTSVATGAQRSTMSTLPTNGSIVR